MPWDFSKLVEKKGRHLKIFFFPFPSYVRSGLSVLNEANGS